VLQQEYRRGEVEAAVNRILKTPARANTSAHATILRLSCSAAGRPRVVTTNFDHLFERVPDIASRDREDADVREPGRGPGDSRESQSDERGRDARDDARWPERERDERTRDTDPREVFTRHLNLPRGFERELVRDRDREYRLRGSESRTLATVGAFRARPCRLRRPPGSDRRGDPAMGA
jgi:hypothetical protein